MRRSTKALSIDGGWSWVVLISSFSVGGLLFGMSKCAGILYTLLPQMYGISRSEAATITSLFTSVMCGLGVLSGMLLKYLTSRQLVVAAGFLSSAGLIICAFAPNASVFLVGFGIVLGLGGGLSVVPCRVILMEYFDIRRQLALGLSVSGSCVGGMVIPPLLERLEEKYGARGALLILSAILLHIIPAGMTLFPQEDAIKFDDENENAVSTVAETVEIKEAANGHTVRQVPIAEEQGAGKRKCSCPMDLSVLINFHFIAIVFSSCCTCAGFSTMNLCFPDFALSEGSDAIDRSDAALLITGLSGGDLCGRVFTSCFSQKIKLKYFFMAGILCTTAVISNVPFFRSYIGLLICAWSYGLVSGIINVIPSMLINEYLPPTKWTSGFGFITMFLSVPIMSVAPIIATIRDYMGSYEYCFRIAGAVNCMALLPWILESFLHRKNNRSIYHVKAISPVARVSKHSEALRASFSM